MTDLIARLEELEKVATPGPWTETGDPHLCCDCPGSLDTGANVAIVLELRNNLPAILRALKVQQAAEAYVDAGGSFLLVIGGRVCCPCCDNPEPWDGEVPDFIHRPDCQLEALVRAVKGEQP